ncbi:hypothetical protein SALBM311S_01339 [Streptomyces alboniger]
MGLQFVVGEAGGVVAVHHADEHTGVAVAHGGRVDSGPLPDLPRGLQEQPLLGIHGQRLARRDPEQTRVELGGPVQEAAAAGVRGTDPVRVGVVQGGQLPAPVGRGSPRSLSRPSDSSRHRSSGESTSPGQRQPIATMTTGSSSGFRCARLGRRGGHRGEEGLVHPLCQRGRSGVVEDQRRGQRQPGRLAEAVDQRDGARGRQPEIGEGTVAVEPFVRSAAADRRRLLQYRGQQRPLPTLRRQGQQPWAQGPVRRRGGSVCGGRGRGPRQFREDRRGGRSCRTPYAVRPRSPGSPRAACTRPAGRGTRPAPASRPRRPARPRRRPPGPRRGRRGAAPPPPRPARRDSAAEPARPPWDGCSPRRG